MSPDLILILALVIGVPIVIATLFKTLWRVPRADEALIITGFGVKGAPAHRAEIEMVTVVGDPSPTQTSTPKPRGDSKLMSPGGMYEAPSSVSSNPFRVKDRRTCSLGSDAELSDVENRMSPADPSEIGDRMVSVHLLPHSAAFHGSPASTSAAATRGQDGRPVRRDRGVSCRRVADPARVSAGAAGQSLVTGA